MFKSLHKNSVLIRLISFLKKRPAYILLLPLFFVLHGVRENFGFIMLKDAGSLLFLYGASVLLLYFVLLLLYRRQQKAGLLTLLLSAVFFFFGAVQDFLKSTVPQLNRYSILLPFVMLLSIAVTILLKKAKSSFAKVSLYLNVLFFLLSAYDLSAIVFKTLFPEKDKFSVYPFARDIENGGCRDCIKPDIYFLLFDEYTSSFSLKNYLGYDNDNLDSFFTSRQFRILKNSTGNYNYTPFAMASLLNMSYINGMPDAEIDIDDFARCIKLVRENRVIKFLSGYGYDIVNYSIFDLAGNPSPLYQDFLPLKAKLITDRTLWGKLKTDILWNLFTGRFEMKWLTRNLVFTHLNNNNQLFGLLEQEYRKKSDKPRFIYAHFNLPHAPFFFDKGGNLRDRDSIRDDYTTRSYLNNVTYANKKIKELVSNIQHFSNGNAVIIVMGDHGFRLDDKLPKRVFFENQNAVYLPGKDYRLFYDSISGVNQFRVIFNSLFKQHLPLLQDSSTFLIHH